MASILTNCDLVIIMFVASMSFILGQILWVIINVTIKTTLGYVIFSVVISSWLSYYFLRFVRSEFAFIIRS